MKARIFTTAVVLAAIGSFTLPFFALYVVHTGEGPLIHYTGLELLLGTTFHRPLQFEGGSVLPRPLKRVSSAWFLLLVIACAGAVGWLPTRWRHAIIFALGLVVLVANLWMVLDSGGAITRTIPDHLRADPQRAIWYSFIGGLGLLVVGLVGAATERKKASAAADAFG